MKLTLLRHGETEENIHHIIQGQKPGKLSELGKQQALEVAEKLKDVKYDVIYSSDLARCVDTAVAVHKLHPNTPIHYDKAIRELSFGVLEGKRAFFFYSGTSFGAALNLRAPGGEKWTELRARVTEFINKVYEKYPDGRVLIISHGGPIRVLLSLLSDEEIKKPHSIIVPNCSTWELEMNHSVKAKK